MTLSTAAWREILDSEMYTDMRRLREGAAHGLTPHLRAEVWTYLLGIAHPDKTDEMRRRGVLEDEYVEKLQRHGSSRPVNQIRRVLHSLRLRPDYVSALRTNRALYALVDRILSVFLQAHPYVPFSESLLCVATLVGSVFSAHHAEEWKAYHALEEFMRILGNGAPFRFEHVRERLGRFRMLFRMTQPHLWELFDDEDAWDGNWLTSWMSYMLIPELPLEISLRLWDTYLSLSAADRDRMHIHVCLAVLQSSGETLREFDHSEISLFVSRLPNERYDVAKLLERSYNIGNVCNNY